LKGEGREASQEAKEIEKISIKRDTADIENIAKAFIVPSKDL